MGGHLGHQVPPQAASQTSTQPGKGTPETQLLASGSQSTRSTRRSVDVGPKATSSRLRTLVLSNLCGAGDAQRPAARPRLCPAEAQWRPAAAGARTSAAPPPTAPPPSAPRTWPQRLGDSENQQEEQQEDTAVCLGHHLSSVHRPRGSRVTPRGGQSWPRGEGEGRTPA